jgi:3-methyladenine DNA glycosylase/8-oxoguanine DNA glycosylase
VADPSVQAMNEQTEEDQAQRDLFELVALDSNLSIADRKISQLRKLRMEPCGNLVKPTDPDYAECAEVK